MACWPTDREGSAVPTVEFHRSGHVAEIRLNRPASLNAIDDEMDRALADAWEHVDGDPDIRVAVLSGTGDRAFCAGADIANPPLGHDGLSFGGGLTGIGGRLNALRKPLICAVQGHVLGLGFELAMCADIIIAAEDAVFRLPEARAGIIDHCGVVHRAIRQLPHHVAMAMIIASEPLTAQDALRFGLINACVDRSALPAETTRWIAKLLECSPLVSQAGKEAALDGLRHSLPDALSASYPQIKSYQAARDCAEAAVAWKERRAPQWLGR
nr:enoyl-CoA hydratase-related protein [Sphingobium sp. EM0848]